MKNLLVILFIAATFSPLATINAQSPQYHQEKAKKDMKEMREGKNPVSTSTPGSKNLEKKLEKEIKRQIAEQKRSQNTQSNQSSQTNSSSQTTPSK